MLAVAVMIVMAAAVPVSAAGSGSITIKNATANTEYTAYKIFDVDSSSADGEKVVYTIDSSNKSIIGDDAPFKVTENNGKNVVEKKDNASEAEIVTWLSNNYTRFGAGISEISETADDDGNATCTINNLDYGYYYIAAGNGSAISIDTVTPNKELYIKDTHGPNTPTKEITKEDGVASGGVTENSADVGSTETFSVTYNATNYVNKTTTTDGTTTTTATKIEDFYIKDTPTNLDIKTDTVTVKVNGKEITNTANDTRYEVSNNTGSLTIKIKWTDTDGNSLYSPKENDENADEKYGNIPVTVTYDATVTADAATAAATNEARIYYNHDSSSGSDGEEVTTPSNPPKTTTYTYKFKLNKVDENGDELAGAKFALYDGDNPVQLIAISEGSATYRVATGTENGDATIDMTSNTTVYITGLDNKTYMLKETQAPEGYNKAADTTVSTQLVKADAGYGDGITIENKAGSLLPSTGGIGTTIFYVLGALLIIGAGVVLIARRRMNSNQ